MRRAMQAAAVVAGFACSGSLGASPANPAAIQATGAARSCDATTFSGLSIDGARVRAAEMVAAGAFTPPGQRSALSALPGFCRVQASVSATRASLVNFEVWIPAPWNGKLVVSGNGGYSNALDYRAMGYALSQGYAAAGGDTGHQTPTPDDLLWGAGHPERILDWGTRSIHAITGPARLIVQRAQLEAPRRAYYYGCSTGGHQGYAEIQRYPQDFDGVIAGAPGNNRVRLNVGFLWQFLANRRRGDEATTILPASKLPSITRAVVAACDANDGVADGIVDDPRSCAFDPAALLCRAGEGPECLTGAQVEALTRMYAGPSNPRTGEQLYPGWPKGSEAVATSPDGRPAAGWHQYWGTTEPARANFWRSWVFEEPEWNWWSFDFDGHVARADAKVGGLVDQVNPDIAAFKARGGRAIVYQGWQDPVVSALDTIAYYERVRARQGSQQEIDRFFRLFLVPGMGHCGGGPGATSFGNQGAPPVVDAQHDLLSALDAWVERGAAPDRLVASRVVDGVTRATRALCPYPRRAVFLGQGGADNAASFACR